MSVIEQISKTDPTLNGHAAVHEALLLLAKGCDSEELRELFGGLQQERAHLPACRGVTSDSGLMHTIFSISTGGSRLLRISKAA